MGLHCVGRAVTCLWYELKRHDIASRFTDELLASQSMNLRAHDTKIYLARGYVFFYCNISVRVNCDHEAKGLNSPNGDQPNLFG